MRSAAAAHPLRAGLVGLVLTSLAALPLLTLFAQGPDLGAAVESVVAGISAALDAVGWVLVPQTVLAVAVLGAALQRLSYRAAGVNSLGAPRWIDPAIESALLLGMLGTISGMVDGFVGLSPDELQPGPLVHGLGTALRSSFVGFGIALVGVSLRAQPGDEDPSMESER